MESDNLSCEQVSSALTSAGIGNHAVRPQNGRLFPLTANSDHGNVYIYGNIYIMVTDWNKIQNILLLQNGEICITAFHARTPSTKAYKISFECRAL